MVVKTFIQLYSAKIVSLKKKLMEASEKGTELNY